jgi:hypothetical protein
MVSKAQLIARIRIWNSPRDAQRAVLLQVKWLQIGLRCIPGFGTKVEPLPGRQSATEEERQWR